jgi:hypothetical protein
MGKDDGYLTLMGGGGIADLMGGGPGAITPSNNTS